MELKSHIISRFEVDDVLFAEAIFNFQLSPSKKISSFQHQ